MGLNKDFNVPFDPGTHKQVACGALPPSGSSILRSAVYNGPHVLVWSYRDANRVRWFPCEPGFGPLRNREDTSLSRRLLIALGSNLGNRKQALRDARRSLAQQYEPVQKSSVRNTKPHGVDTERPFLNQVVEYRDPSTPTPCALIEDILDREQELGRNRDQHGPDRRIDIDVLYWGSVVVRGEPTLPHPRLHRRRFVLEPLVDLVPDFPHPIFGYTQEELFRKLIKHPP